MAVGGDNLPHEFAASNLIPLPILPLDGDKGGGANPDCLVRRGAPPS